MLDKVMVKKSRNINMPQLLIRAGLAIVFLYAGVSSLQHPLEWLGYVPGFLTKFASAGLILKGMAAYELALGVWLLSGKFVRYAAALSALTLAGIIVSNTGQFIITFRDIGLLFAAAALFFIDEVRN
jgi:uncharacterized membrane protein YphA (DoxX/SURF4 family)